MKHSHKVDSYNDKYIGLVNFSAAYYNCNVKILPASTSSSSAHA